VITVEGDQMLVDTNHPFAGRDLTIRLRVSASVAGNDTSSCCGPEGCC
jgi:FKBP-type peptidyl-prolyl cis-trans isomerase 2